MSQRSPAAAGVLLAAGAGTRFGMPKVLAERGAWLRAAVAALSGGGCDEVVVVLGAAVVDVPAPARAVIARDWRRGPGASLRVIGHDDDGSPIHLFVLDDGSGASPDSIRAAGKNILWITNGIHPGEPDGIDASLLLAQALLDSDQYMGLLSHTAVCIVPVYNVSGAKVRNSTSRVNQMGPVEYGFRGNARNLNLNRDFIKADARNTRTLVSALNTWDPDVYFETHVSNGADHRYVMELLVTHPDKLDTNLRDEGAEGAIRRTLLHSQDKAATLYYQFVRPSELCR